MDVFWIIFLSELMNIIFAEKSLVRYLHGVGTPQRAPDKTEIRRQRTVRYASNAGRSAGTAGTAGRGVALAADAGMRIQRRSFRVRTTEMAQRRNASHFDFFFHFPVHGIKCPNYSESEHTVACHPVTGKFSWWSGMWTKALHVEESRANDWPHWKHWETIGKLSLTQGIWHRECFHSRRVCVAWSDRVDVIILHVYIHF